MCARLMGSLLCFLVELEEDEDDDVVVFDLEPSLVELDEDVVEDLGLELVEVVVEEVDFSELAMLVNTRIFEAVNRSLDKAPDTSKLPEILIWGMSGQIHTMMICLEELAGDLENRHFIHAMWVQEKVTFGIPERSWMASGNLCTLPVLTIDERPMASKLGLVET